MSPIVLSTTFYCIYITDKDWLLSLKYIASCVFRAALIIIHCLVWGSHFFGKNGGLPTYILLSFVITSLFLIISCLLENVYMIVEMKSEFVPWKFLLLSFPYFCGQSGKNGPDRAMQLQVFIIDIITCHKYPHKNWKHYILACGNASSFKILDYVTRTILWPMLLSMIGRQPWILCTLMKSNIFAIILLPFLSRPKTYIQIQVS